MKADKYYDKLSIWHTEWGTCFKVSKYIFTYMVCCFFGFND